jgi:hypothetical protein
LDESRFGIFVQAVEFIVVFVKNEVIEIKSKLQEPPIDAARPTTQPAARRFEILDSLLDATSTTGWTNDVRIPIFVGI